MEGNGVRVAPGGTARRRWRHLLRNWCHYKARESSLIPPQRVTEIHWHTVETHSLITLLFLWVVPFFILQWSNTKQPIEGKSKMGFKSKKGEEETWFRWGRGREKARRSNCCAEKSNGRVTFYTSLAKWNHVFLFLQNSLTTMSLFFSSNFESSCCLIIGVLGLKVWTVGSASTMIKYGMIEYLWCLAPRK